MINAFLSDSAESNAYIVSAGRTCLIDSGISPLKVLNHIRDYNIRIDTLINTHCHFDHVGGNLKILSLGKIEACCHESDAKAIEAGDASYQMSDLFGEQPMMHPVGRKLKDGDYIDLDGVILEVIHTPGHTRGSICLYEPQTKSLFSGDTVFQSSVGRTDLKGGSMYDLERSLNKLTFLVEERGVDKLYPGHGETGCGDDIKKAFKLFF